MAPPERWSGCSTTSRRSCIGKTRADPRSCSTALACGGHVLLEDVPGTAKTVLARAIAGSIEGADASRDPVHARPPADRRHRPDRLRPARCGSSSSGPARCSRTCSSSTRSTARCRRRSRRCSRRWPSSQVTVDGVTRRLPDPFLLLATENPIEQEGTFPLPEAQLDRFFLRTALGYPDEDEELRIVREQRGGHPLDALEPVVTADEVAELRRRSRGLRRRAAPPLDRRARPRDPRGSSSSRSAPRSAASSRSSEPRAPGRSCTAATTSQPEDVEQLFVPVLGHRLLLDAGSSPRRATDAGRDRSARVGSLPRPRRRGRRRTGTRRSAAAARPRRAERAGRPHRSRSSATHGSRAAVRRAAEARGADTDPTSPDRVRISGRPGLDDRLARARRGSRPRAAATSSSCASRTRRRRRVSSIVPTAGRRWASTRRSCRGSRSRQAAPRRPS